MQGVIVKALSGFYYVKTDSETVECRARGRFRLDGSSPLVGDRVEIFGDGLPVTVLSDALDTIPYEVLTGISNRVKKVYFQD